MNERKPMPLQAVVPRQLCPVCGKASYSLGGTHPQCFVTRADALSRVARKAAGDDLKKLPSKQAWSKPCPKCRRQIQARRAVCECGHQFAGMLSIELRKQPGVSAAARRRKPISSPE